MMQSMGSQTPEALIRLQSLDQVYVRQKVPNKWISLSGNKYCVTDPGGQVLFQVIERTNKWGGKHRAFEIDVLDAQERQVMSFRRARTFRLPKMFVSVCGQLVSVVRQESTFFKPILDINDAADRTVFRVKGSLSSRLEQEFVIFTMNKERIGLIKRTFVSWKRELFTDSDNFTIEFPMDLDVNSKAAIIGTCLLIDYLYFQA